MSAITTRTVRFPPRIIIDTAEQLPFDFSGIQADEELGGGMMQVTTHRQHIKTGDYSLEGFEDRCCVERKSHMDAFGSIVGEGRRRFKDKLDRMSEMEFAAVVLEFDWDQALNQPLKYSSVEPKTFYRTLISWTARWPKVHWWAMPGRRYAAITTFRLLEAWWKRPEKLGGAGGKYPTKRQIDKQNLETTNELIDNANSKNDDR